MSSKLDKGSKLTFPITTYSVEFSDSFARFVIDRMPVALALYDASGQLVYSNPFARRLLGLDETAMRSRSADDSRWRAIREDGSEFPIDEYPINISLRTCKPMQEVLMGVQRPDNAYAWLLINSEPIFKNGDGRPIGVVAIFLDVTDRMHLRDQLYESQKFDAIGKLSGGVAHDMRNILQAIMTSSEVIARTELNDRAAKQLEVIRNATRRGSALTEQLLTVARRRLVEPKPLDLCQTIAANVALLQPIVGDRVDIKTSCPADLWKIHADSGLIGQVIMNLVLNARDAMPNGGTIQIEAINADATTMPPAKRANFQQPNCVLMSVTDNGSGIAPEILDKIFDPYFTTKATSGGHAGLGLAVVHGIVEQLRGRIWVHSEPGAGASFKVAFPRFEI